MKKKQMALIELKPADDERKNFCGHCLEEITADQPGGLNPRHKATGIPYGRCVKALRNRVDNRE